MKKYIHLPCSANLTWISPAFPVEQLLFIHKVTGSTQAWRHLHLTSCRLTYVNFTQAHACTWKHLASHLAVSHPPHYPPSPSPYFSRLQYTICFVYCNMHKCFGTLGTLHTCLWEDLYGEALVPMKLKLINSNQSKRDYVVNYLCSHLG